MKKPYSSSLSCSPKRLLGARAKLGGQSKLGGSNANAESVQSCFSYQSLARIARRYNEANPRDKITIHRTRDELWQAIQRKMPECHDERCWTKARYLTSTDRKQLTEDFKPPIPQGKHAWLNTKDIDHVMHGYERAVPSFHFLGTHPIDFQSLEDKKRFTLPSISKRGKTHAGLVLNLDSSDEPGSHWVAVVLDLKDRVFEYFDSYGDAAPAEVHDFYESLNRSGRWRYLENKTTHQRQNSECGVYAIHFLVRRLSGDSFKVATQNVIRDAEMNQMRTRYFDPHTPYNNHI